MLNKALARGNQETELISTMNNYAEIGDRVGAGNGEPIAAWSRPSPLDTEHADVGLLTRHGPKRGSDVARNSFRFGKVRWAPICI